MVLDLGQAFNLATWELDGLPIGLVGGTLDREVGGSTTLAPEVVSFSKARH